MYYNYIQEEIRDLILTFLHSNGIKCDKIPQQGMGHYKNNKFLIESYGKVHWVFTGFSTH